MMLLTWNSQIKLLLKSLLLKIVWHLKFLLDPLKIGIHHEYFFLYDFENLLIIEMLRI